jgi:hypothetical protein
MVGDKAKARLILLQEKTKQRYQKYTKQRG